LPPVMNSNQKYFTMSSNLQLSLLYEIPILLKWFLRMSFIPLKTWIWIYLHMGSIHSPHKIDLWRIKF
jgi:hypothetical protein